MKNLIIIAAGSMGRTTHGIAKESIGYGTDYLIKGFIDDNLHALDGFPNYPPIIGTISEYKPQPDDVFVCSIGGSSRRTCIENLLAIGAQFINIVHTSARIRTNVQMGEGNVICPYVSIGADARMGSFNMIQPFTTIGHDVVIGDYTRIDTHVTCVGEAKIGNEVDIYTGAVVNFGVRVEDGAHVGACSFVIRKVKAGTTVYGNPAKVLM